MLYMPESPKEELRMHRVGNLSYRENRLETSILLWAFLSLLCTELEQQVDMAHGVSVCVSIIVVCPCVRVCMNPQYSKVNDTEWLVCACVNACLPACVCLSSAAEGGQRPAAEGGQRPLTEWLEQNRSSGWSGGRWLTHLWWSNIKRTGGQRQ